MKLSSLRHTYEPPGSTATAYLAPGVPDADAAPSVDLRWRAVAERLVAQGADERIVVAAGEEVLARPPGRTTSEGIVVVVAGGEAVFSDSLRGPVGGDHAHWGPLPDLGRYVRANADTGRQVMAVVDRSGADLVVRDTGGSRRRRTEGIGHPLHKVRGGAWSHKRIQNSVEEASERNATMVADKLVELISQTKPSTVLLAGEVEARSRVFHRLPSSLRPMVSVTDHGGGSGADRELTAALDEAATAADQAARRALLERFGNGLSSGRAVQGAPDVLAALRAGAVDVLLFGVVDPDAGTHHQALDQEVSIGPGPLQVAASPGELRDLLAGEGIESGSDSADVRQENLDAAIVRAGAATDATAEVVPQDEADLCDGIGALLRFALPS